MTLRKSPRGTQFFAHKAVGDCASGRETEAHLSLKRIVVKVARGHGWEAQTEVVGVSPAGETWKADVLAFRGERRVAIEIQWSAQTHDETLRRQARYAASGVRCLWLFRQAAFPVDRTLPAARIHGGAEEGFAASLGAQVLPIEEFLDAAFKRQLRFGLPTGVRAHVSVQVGAMSCWSCGAETEIITGIEMAAGPHEFRFSVPELTRHPGVYEAVRRRLPDNAPIGAIRRRWSKTQGREYLSNGCSHCDAIIGEFHEQDAWNNQQTAVEYPTNVDEGWLRVIRERDGEVVGWGIY